jgi:hypothetical protein
MFSKLLKKRVLGGVLKYHTHFDTMMEKQMKFYSKPNSKERKFIGKEFNVNENVTLYGWIENIRKM